MTTSTVLLTATVRPNTQLYVAQADPLVRLGQYQRAIASWVDAVEAADADLFIVETSGATADDLLLNVPVASRASINVLSFDAGDTKADRGKGRIEAEAILHGLSAIQQTSGAGGTVYKGTGRLVVRNAARILRRLPPEAVQIRMTADRSFADTRLLGASIGTWQQVVLADRDYIDEMRGVFLEHTVAASVGRAAALKTIQIQRFSQRPSFDGQSGSTGRQYRSAGQGPGAILRRIAEGRLAALAARKQV
jgi:hypothetical protein